MHWNHLFTSITVLSIFCSHSVWCQVYNISEISSCMSEPCLSLTDFSTHLESYLYSNTTLVLLPGNHSLQVNLLVSNVTEFSVVASDPDSQNTIILCNMTGLTFKEVVNVHISGVTFRECGGNTVQNVDHFTLDQSIFLGSPTSKTALVINQTDQTTVSRCVFANYILGSTYNINLSQYYSMATAGSLEVGGALIVIHSSAEIYQSVFEQNSAELGTALFAVDNSIIKITDSRFLHNYGRLSSNSAPGHSIFVIDNCSLLLQNCTLSNNNGTFGVIGVFNSETYVNLSYFISNEAGYDGGAITSYRAQLTLDQSVFIGNFAKFLGGALQATESVITVMMSNFSYNRANNLGGAIHIKNSSLTIYDSEFTYSSAYEGGVIYALTRSEVTISRNRFNSNYADLSGGVFVIQSGSILEECDSTFTNNSAQNGGGVIEMSQSKCIFMQSTFNENEAPIGGTISASQGTLHLINVTFTNNTATNDAVLYVTTTSVHAEYCKFLSNSAKYGAIINIFLNSINITESIFSNNLVFKGVLQTTQCNLVLHGLTVTDNSGVFTSMHIYQGSAEFSGNTFIKNNIGSMFVYDSHVTFVGNISFIGGLEPSNQSFYQGGALTMYQSEIKFNGTTDFRYNTARRGGAFIAIESYIYVYEKTTLANNKATDVGGGVYIYQSEIVIVDTVCIFMSNQASNSGGGAHAVSSYIITTTENDKLTYLYFVNNSAIQGGGGGVHLEANSKLYILKRTPEINERHIEVGFFGNYAQNGGGIYVADETNSGACANSTECFFQTLSLHMKDSFSMNTVNTVFSQNYAIQWGDDIFGGLIDRCIPGMFAEVLQINDAQTNTYNGTYYLLTTSNITRSLNSVASSPVQVCFCRDGLPDCTRQSEKKTVKKGEQFTIEVAAVDQIHHPISTNITISLQSTNSGLKSGQVSQYVNETCTNLTFNVQSEHNSEKLYLNADGPCSSRAYSMATISVGFAPCTCPIGFDAIETSNNCDCTCASLLSPHIKDCDSVNGSFIKTDRSWISYTNETEPNGYIIHRHCPFDYCLPPSDLVRINLNTLSGEDAQCNFNRRGTLCGGCKEPFSLSFGTSECLECPSYWPALFVLCILFVLIFGIATVAVIMVLNLTVAIGTINSTVFYVNIIDIQSSVLFSFEDTKVQSTIISFLNLDFGLNLCLLKGLDAYTRTWLKIIFPAYIIFLVILVIALSKYSNKFARFIGKRDPVATLATLILLSYTRLLDFIIDGIALVTVNLPNGSVNYVWLPDANVDYLVGKHAPLFIVTFTFLIVYSIFTILLLVWQWLGNCRKSRPLKLINSQKFASFIETYHIPFNASARYWTGLLLLVRIVLHIVNIANVNKNPHLQLSATIFTMAVLLFIKGLYTKSVYRQWPIDAMETLTYFNVIFFATFTSYTIESDGNQVAVAVISTSIAFIMFIIIVAYHIYKYTCVGKLLKRMNLRKRLTARLQTIRTKDTSQSETNTENNNNDIYINYPHALDMSRYRNSIFELVEEPRENDYVHDQLQTIQSASSTKDKETIHEPPTFSTVDLSEDSPDGS